MSRRMTSYDSNATKDGVQDEIATVRSKPAHIYDNLCRRLLQLGITLGVITFIGLIVRYAVKELDNSSPIVLSTSTSGNKDLASFTVSKHFLERILEFIEQSIAIVAVIIPLGLPICTVINKKCAKLRVGSSRVRIKDDKILNVIPKYIIFGDSQVFNQPSTTRSRPLVKDVIHQLSKSYIKPKLVTEDSFEDARKLGISIGLIKKEHHKLAVIRSVDLLKNITDSRGDIKQSKVCYLLSRMKIMSQSTPADKSFLIYLIKKCHPLPNENLIYLGYAFTDPEAMKLADCGVTFQDCDDDDVKRESQVLLRSKDSNFADVYLFLITCLLSSNITQSFALFQVSMSVSCCLYRFLTIMVFQDYILSNSQFVLITIIYSLLGLGSLMTKWLSSLPRAPLKPSNLHHHSGFPSSTTTLRTNATSFSGNNNNNILNKQKRASQANLSAQHRASINPQQHQHHKRSSSYQPPLSTDISSDGQSYQPLNQFRQPTIQLDGSMPPPPINPDPYINLDETVINNGIISDFRQTFHHSKLIDDVTFKLIKLHIIYHIIVMLIVMVFGKVMFQINVESKRQHQTMAFNSLMLNNIFNLINCFNQSGSFNLLSGSTSHPFFVCLLVFSIFLQITLTETNAFGLENLSPDKWFFIFVFAILGALIAPITGQQNRIPSQDLRSIKKQKPRAR